jgi:hypothetical protein
MFLSLVKPSQSESNQMKIKQVISSAEIGAEGVLTRDVTEGLRMGRFDATILYN